MIRQFKLSVVLIVIVNSCFAQLQVKNYFSFAGKKDLPVNAICQDLTGFLWLATDDGVYNFDGKNSNLLLPNHSSLRTKITSIYYDNSETLWIGTDKGQVYFLFKNKLDSVLLKTNDSKITSFCKLKSKLFIATYGNGLFEMENKQQKHYMVENGLSENVIYKLASDDDKKLWCATDAGITECSINSAQLNFKIIANKSGLPDNIVRDLYYVKNKLFVAMQDSGISVLNLATKIFETDLFFKNWSLGTVLNVVEYQKGKLLIATERKGLLQFDNGKFNLFDYQVNLETQVIQQLFVDKSQQIWLASKRGITRLSEKRFAIIDNKLGLSNEKVLALAVDNDNAIWLGTTMGISKISTNDEGKLIVTPITEHQKYTISCATKAPDGNIWFGTYGNGIVILSSETKNSVVLNSADDAISNDNISHIHFHDNHTVYLSTLGGGLIKVHVELEDKYKVFKVSETLSESMGLGSDYVYASITDKNSNLFIATDGGGLQLFENGKFRNLIKENGFKSNTVFSLCRDKYNNIWGTTNADGVIKYDGKKLTSFNLENGLRDLHPQQIIAVDDILYAINSKGIDKINCNTNEINYYDVFESDMEPNLNAMFYHQNKLYSGTNKGILVYRTSKEKSDSIKPIAYIKSVLVNYKLIKMDSAFEFSHNQNNFSISFDGIWLKNPDKLKFRYRLNGLEENWQYADEEKTINYNNLNSGNYTFIVQTKNEEDIWSEPTGYAFIVLAPIWKKWWFWLIVLVIMIGSIYAFVKVRLKALQRENIILEQKVTIRTHEIAEQKKVIEEKQKEIIDSISYASKIQHAILPADKLIKEHIPNSFVLYLTKDIVSGDFYWFAHFEEFSIIASVDCTGHGVPGAFMSLIGYNQLNHIVNELNITDPKEILLQLNIGVLSVLHKNETESKDGMDIAICKINHVAKTLEYAGAMRPLWIVSNGELTEIKADKIPIGTKQSYREEKIAYTTHTFSLETGASYYIFSDGYADQFGGPKDKKFSTGKFKELLIQNANKDFETQHRELQNAHKMWKGNLEQVDDILVIGFKA